ncbi:hypothetical protein VNO77_16565 [Canavalia gladiata]|uniref:Uncharacterized protein n=1 Tax=Canavalia gladiata TaxID=3824 RepID=A0AAN9QSB4_CANGL
MLVCYVMPNNLLLLIVFCFAPIPNTCLVLRFSHPNWQLLFFYLSATLPLTCFATTQSQLTAIPYPYPAQLFTSFKKMM